MGLLGDNFDWKEAALGFFADPHAMAARQRRQQAQQELEREQALMAPAMEAIDSDPRMTPAQKAYAKANLGEFTKRQMEQFGTFNQSPGSQLAIGAGGGEFDTFAGPSQKSWQDGVLFDEGTGEAVTESPYPRIIPGQDGAFFEQPRIGIRPDGQQPEQQAPQGAPQGGDDAQSLREEAAEAIRMGADPVQVLQELTRMMGGASQPGSPTFPGPF